MKHVKIYGTIGPACRDKEILKRMFQEGMDGVRLNLSHTSLEEASPLIESFHSAARECGLNAELLIDMQGPELRIGDMNAPFSLITGDLIGIEDIPFPEDVKAVLRDGDPGQEILLDDGKILLRVTKTGKESAFARVVRGGRLTGRKSIKVPGADIRLPAMTKADRQNVRDALGCGVTGIMQPFVRSREDLEEVRGVLAENGAQKLQLVAKIENRAGMDQLAELLPACDAVCIARGDLGNDMELWQLPAAQKQIAAACRAAGKYFMTATQMLSSMEQSAVPTRAEVNDIFNTVADGASGVMVTGETAVGRYPVEVIRYLAKTAAEGERYREILNS